MAAPRPLEFRVHGNAWRKCSAIRLRASSGLLTTALGRADFAATASKRSPEVLRRASVGIGISRQTCRSLSSYADRLKHARLRACT